MDISNLRSLGLLLDTSLVTEGRKNYTICIRRHNEQTFSEHTLECLSLAGDNLASNPYLVLGIIIVNTFMNFVRLLSVPEDLETTSLHSTPVCKYIDSYSIYVARS